ncbi:hypothetical protein E4656_04130 [Natronospirillum operosum]|uniref:Uncharacterized protein n=1 Tax=Natronospirillum operosum TaxID=2759953 RepID=A0A4Z0WAD4_9GAMM|nr:hypothetical protein [Natronospirillum operosum]TGG95609.1 hypothetical protein E4656_04130 [Natronospirillum operosum]
MTDRILPLVALAFIFIGTLLYQLADLDWGLWLASPAILAFLVLRWHAMSNSPRILIGLAAASALTLPWLDAPASVLREAFERGGYFATFLISLTFLRLAAQQSRMIRRCGEWAVIQPPGRRYGMLSYATALFGTILNFGVLHLLGLMVLRGNSLVAAWGQESIQRLRQKRMSQAMLRGFAALPLASPFSVTLIVLLTMIPDLRWQAILPIGLVTAVLLILIGWILDHYQHRNVHPPGPRARPPADAWQAAVQLIALIATLVGAAFMLEGNTVLNLPMSVLVLSPLFSLAWFVWQGRRAGWAWAPRLTARRLRKTVPGQVVPLSGEVGLLAAAGFLGSVTTALISVDQVVWLLNLLHLQGVPLLIAAMVLTILLGQVGFNPIVSVTLLAAALQPVELFGLTQELLALGLMSAWSLTVNSSPFTISVAVTARLARVSPRYLAYYWNGHYLLFCLVFLSLWLYGLSWIY